MGADLLGDFLFLEDFTEGLAPGPTVAAAEPLAQPIANEAHDRRANSPASVAAQSVAARWRFVVVAHCSCLRGRLPRFHIGLSQVNVGIGISQEPIAFVSTRARSIAALFDSARRDRGRADGRRHVDDQVTHPIGEPFPSRRPMRCRAARSRARARRRRASAVAPLAARRRRAARESERRGRPSRNPAPGTSGSASARTSSSASTTPSSTESGTSPADSRACDSGTARPRLAACQEESVDHAESSAAP